jgi:hypothetical protein
MIFFLGSIAKQDTPNVLVVPMMMRPSSATTTPRKDLQSSAPKMQTRHIS